MIDERSGVLDDCAALASAPAVGHVSHVSAHSLITFADAAHRAFRALVTHHSLN